MRGSLNRLSLVTVIDAPFREPQPEYFLHPAGRDPELSRVIMHEATHYWQQLSETFLLMVAAEDWQRLQIFLRTGRVDGPDELNRRLRASDSTLGFSPLDLAECASRYWDILNLGPHNLVEAALADGAELDDETQRMYDAAVELGGFRMDDDGFTTVTVEVAMRVVGGAYARPYLRLQERTGLALPLFPLVAHWALQTPAPVTLFDEFADLASRKLLNSRKWEGRARRLLRRAVAFNELREEQMKWYWYLAGPIAKLTKKRGFQLWTGGQYGRFTSLAEHAVYGWAFDWSDELGRAAVNDGQADDMKHLFRKDPEALRILAADRIMALPGGPEREMLQTYLGPPIHRFSDDEIWFTNVESDHGANVAIADHCMKIHDDWEAFRTARRGY